MNRPWDWRETLRKIAAARGEDAPTPKSVNLEIPMPKSSGAGFDERLRQAVRRPTASSDSDPRRAIARARDRGVL